MDESGACLAWLAYDHYKHPGRGSEIQQKTREANDFAGFFMRLIPVGSDFVFARQQNAGERDECCNAEIVAHVTHAVIHL